FYGSRGPADPGEFHGGGVCDAGGRSGPRNRDWPGRERDGGEGVGGRRVQNIPSGSAGQDRDEFPHSRGGRHPLSAHHGNPRLCGRHARPPGICHVLADDLSGERADPARVVASNQATGGGGTGGANGIRNCVARDGQCSRVLDGPGTPWKATMESILLTTNRGSAISGTTSQRAAMGSRMVRAASSTSYSMRCSRTRRMMGAACSAVPGRSISTAGPLQRKGDASEGRDCTRYSTKNCS